MPDPATETRRSPLFEPLQLRSVELPNRLVVSPMCQYSCEDGIPGDYHLAHLGRFALGGFGLVILEASAVVPEGRISPWDLGIWSDRHIEPLRRIVELLHANGARVGIQLAHAGPKGSSRRPWEGGGPLNADDPLAWQTVSVTDKPVVDGYPSPVALDEDAIAALVDAFAAAAGRAEEAGFDLVEIHGGHGYLLNTFTSHLSNTRSDRYGEDPQLFPLEIAAAIRKRWPDDKPVSYRVSAVDAARDVPGAVTIDDTVAFARRLAETGVDIVDCSSGGIGGAYEHPIGPGYQVPFAEAVRREADVPTVAVGLITEAAQAESIITEGRADLVALAREALYDPNWPLHARLELEGPSSFDHWPKQAGSRLAAREQVLGRRTG